MSVDLIAVEKQRTPYCFTSPCAFVYR